MKKLILLLVSLLVVSASGFSQETIKFMGIPVDGTEEEMIKSLEKKGFTYNSSVNPTLDVLFGVFNGRNVSIGLDTVNNKVWKICVYYCSSLDKYFVMQVYNVLYSEFYNNDKYIHFNGKRIDNYEEDLINNINRDKSAYVVSFYQKGTEGVIIEDGLVWYKIWVSSINDEDLFGITIYYENFNNAPSE